MQFEKVFVIMSTRENTRFIARATFELKCSWVVNSISFKFKKFILKANSTEPGLITLRFQASDLILHCVNLCPSKMDARLMGCFGDTAYYKRLLLFFDWRLRETSIGRCCCFLIGDGNHARYFIEGPAFLRVLTFFS